MAAVSKLIRWLPKAVEATAEDIARFGPQAGRVRQLLDFLPTMSDEAAKATRLEYSSPTIRNAVAEIDKALWATKDAQRTLAAERAEIAGTDSGSINEWWQTAVPAAAAEAAMVESVADLVSPEVYRTLTNPLNASRAIDLLRNRPRYQGTPFLDVVQQLAERGAITGPRDVLRAGRIAQQDKDVMETALSLMLDPNNTIPLSQIVRSARALAL